MPWPIKPSPTKPIRGLFDIAHLAAFVRSAKHVP
jgi:hypothetical protein